MDSHGEGARPSVPVGSYLVLRLPSWVLGVLGKGWEPGERCPPPPRAPSTLVRPRVASAAGVLKAGAGGGAAQSSRRPLAVAWNSVAWRPVRACADMASNGTWGEREAAMARLRQASSPCRKAFGFFSYGGSRVAGECGLPHLWREAAGGGGEGRAASPFCLAPLAPWARRLRAFSPGPVRSGRASGGTLPGDVE